MSMGAPMASSRDSRRQRRTFQVGQSFFKPFIFSVEGAFLAAHAPHLATYAGCVPTNCHSRNSALARSEKCDFGAKCIFVAVICRFKVFDQTRHSRAGNFGKTSAGHA